MWRARWPRYTPMPSCFWKRRSGPILSGGRKKGHSAAPWPMRALSDRSYPRYKRLGFLFRNLFGSFDTVCAQDETQAERFRAVGCRPECVHTVGNLKFDGATVPEKDARCRRNAEAIKRRCRCANFSEPAAPTTEKKSFSLKSSSGCVLKFPNFFLLSFPAILNAVMKLRASCANVESNWPFARPLVPLPSLSKVKWIASWSIPPANCGNFMNALRWSLSAKA